MSQASPFQHGRHSYDDLCKWHMDSHTEARKNDQNSATKDASTYHTDKKKVQKEIFKQQKRRGARWKKENNENLSDKETEEELQEDSNTGQDSDVSFQEEADEEMDATDNEEEWVEFVKRSTKDAEEHMKNICYHAGLRYTEGQSGGWHEESSLYLRKDGTKDFSNGSLDLTQLFVTKDQLADQQEDGKTISTNSQKQRKDTKKLNMICRTTTAG